MGSLTRPCAKRSNQATIDFEAFYSSLFVPNDWAVFVARVEHDGTFWVEDANSRLAAVAGRPIEDIRGRTLHDALPEPLAECLSTDLQSCAADGRTLTCLRGLDLPDGRMSWKTNLLPVEDETGAVSHIVGITRDITFEEALFNQAERSRTIIAGLGVAVQSTIYLRNLKTTTIDFLGGGVDTQRAAWLTKTDEAEAMVGDLYTHPADRVIRDEQSRKLAELSDGEVLVTQFRVMAPEGEYRRIACRETVFSRDVDGCVEQILGVSDDVTEFEQWEEERRGLVDRINTLQMDERRRLAEELHDSTAQHLTGASLALTRILAARSGEGACDPFVSAAVDDALRSLSEAEREIRTLSYLFHPPALNEMGFVQAVKTFTAGFAKRSGLKLRLHIEENDEPIESEIAHHLLRVCQEGLANAHRHAEATKVEVSLEITARMITLRIVDDGIGIDEREAEGPERGIGLAGMRERMQRLRGRLDLRNWGGGTELVATVPRSF